MIRTKHVLWILAFGLVVPLAAMAAQQTPQSSTPPASTPPAATHHSSTSSKSHAPHVNINTATKEQLMTLPGVTDEIADKIIAGRPFKAKDELVHKNIMTKEEYKKVTNMVTTSHPKPASTTTTKK